MSRLALVLAVCVPAVALALNPFEKNHPLVEDGTQAYTKQDYERALAQYEAAAKERPRDARVHYDRGLALHKLNRNAEAKQAFQQAEELDGEKALTSRIHYNLGNVAAAEGDKKGAVAEYRKALKADPNDSRARHNLEVVLRDLPPPQQNAPDAGDPDAGKSDAGTRPDAGLDGGATDAGVDAGTPDGGQKDGGDTDGGSPPDAGADGGSDGGQPADGGQGDGGRGDGGQGDQPKPGDAGQSDSSQRADGGSDGGMNPDAGDEEEPEPAQRGDGGAKLSKKEAEKLLDSLKSNEKNMQLWRFRQKTTKNDTHGKDW